MKITEFALPEEYNDVKLKLSLARWCAKHTSLKIYSTCFLRFRNWPL